MNYLQENCFYIGRICDNYLQEMVYWTLEKNVARGMANLLYDIHGGKPIKHGKGFVYGWTKMDELLKDINNDETKTIMEFQHNPNLSKREIANRYHNKNFTGDDKYHISQLGVISWQEFEKICEIHGSIILGVLKLCIFMEDPLLNISEC